MRQAFGSLAVRIGAAFVLGLLLLQLVIAAAVLWPDGRPAVFRLVSPRQAAAIATALEAASAKERPLIVDALNHGALVVHLQPGFDTGAADGAKDSAPRLEKLFGEYASELQGRAFEVQARGDAALTSLARNRSAQVPGAVRLLVGLNGGGVVVIERAPALLQRLVARFGLIAAAAAAILLLVMLFCIQQMVRPARRLAHAAHRLAADIDMPDVPVGGATEIRQLSAAFNGMKRTIRGLIDERTRILAAIAHDLRTYLTRLRLRSEFIADADQQARAVRDLDEMGLLLDDTLMFARESTAARPRPPGWIDAAVEVDAFARLRREIGDAVDCKMATAGPLAARCTPLALRRMLANLTDNALRYGKTAHLSVWCDDNAIKVAVEDDGPGAPAEAFARLMQPFERLEPSRGRQTGGAGLGLAIVKALANSQGGDLVIENRAEGGLRATLSLPASDRVRTQLSSSSVTSDSQPH